MEYLLATDPGSHGYITLLSVTDDVMRIEQSLRLKPYTKTDYIELNSFIYRAAKLTKFCMLEHPLPVSYGQGKSMLTQGINYGILLSLMKQHFKHVEIINPNDWQRALGLTGKYKDKLTLQTAVNLVGLPALIPRRCENPQEGLMDALLIGFYGYLNFIKVKDD